MGRMVMMGGLGDVEITWGEDEHDAMIEIIKKKLANGMRFFHIVVDGDGPHRLRVKNVKELKGRRIDIGDEDIEKMFADGRVDAVRSRGQLKNDPKAITDPAIIAQSSTVAVQPMTGG